MEVLAKLKSSKTRKNTQSEQPPSKDDIISTLENFSVDKTQANKENNNNSKSLSRQTSLEGKWEIVDCDPVSTPASLSHSYSLEWESLFSKPNLMKRLKERALEGNLRSSRFRSVIWKLFLEVLPPQMNEWVDRTRKSRSKFEELKNTLIVNPRKAVDTVDITLNNPLSQDEESPWNKFFQDNELRLTIKQDVIRTFPEVEFFRSQEMTEMMIVILFCFCREHASHSYKQGMHELLAPLIFILHCDHQAFLHACEIETVLYCTEEARGVMKEVMDPAYLEHDAYTMFCQVMETVEPWYLSRDMFYCRNKSGSMRNLELVTATPFARSQDLNPSSAIVTKLTRIQDYILKKFDPELHQHLERLEIVPQIYGIRWLRLLFGREFPMQDLLMLWDAIFADGIGFDLVDYIFVAMLLYIRDILLTSDYATCLTILMKYPPVPDVHYFVVKAMWIREPNQFPRPPAYTHQGSIRTSSSMDGSVDNNTSSGGAGGISRETSKMHTRNLGSSHKRHNNVLGGFSSFSRKFSRPRTLAVPKSSSEPMNLQTDVSPDHNPIGSTVSLSHVEESMFRQAPSASSLTRMESSNLRSAQSSPGAHPSAAFPLTPDDASVPCSPTRYSNIHVRAKGKHRKPSKFEKELEEKVSHLQGELNDKNSMCRYCASKLDVHIGRLQQDLSHQNIEVDDDIMVSLAGLKLVRDILNGTLKFSQTIAADDDEFQINDDYYSNPDGGADNSSTGVTSPDSDIVMGAACADDDPRLFEQPKHKLFYMSSEDTNSPDSGQSGSLGTHIIGQGKGSNFVELEDLYGNMNAPAGEVGEKPAITNRTASVNYTENNLSRGVAISRNISGSAPLSSKIRHMFHAGSTHGTQQKDGEAKSSNEPNVKVSKMAYRPPENDRPSVSPSVRHPDRGLAINSRRHSRDGCVDKETTSTDSRRKVKSYDENPFRWPAVSSSPPKKSTPRSHHSGYSDEEGQEKRQFDRKESEQKGRERSKSQPSAFSGHAFHPLYSATGKEDKTRLTYLQQHQDDVEH